MPPDTSTPLPAPRTLDAWVKQLDSVALPVPAANHKRVRAALHDSRRSLRDIANMIQDSPVLVLSVMREANPHTTKLTEPVENLDVAISRLGLARTEVVLNRLPTLETKDTPTAFRQLLLISQHATQQANGLFAGRLARLWQDIHLGSLLFLSPLWPMALAYPKLLDEWEMRVMHQDESSRAVEQELFGVSLVELCVAISELWRLPLWVTLGYRLLISEQRQLVKALHIARKNDDPLLQQQMMDADPQLHRWLSQPANTVLLGNALALSAQQAWDSPHCLRWELLTSLYLQQPLDTVQQQVHQNAASSARATLIQNVVAPGIWHPAEALLWPWDARRVHRGMPAVLPPSAEILQRWRKQCAQLLIEPSPFNNGVHLTTSARDALLSCGMQRVMLMMMDKTATMLRVHQIGGLQKEAAETVLYIKESTALQRLLAQPTQLRITPANIDQFSALLPGSIRSLFNGQHWLIRSLSCNGKVVMLVFADQGGGPFSEISVQAFGKTCQCIERAMTSFSGRKA